MRAYDQGEQDYKNGVSFFENPHVYDNSAKDDFYAWMAGWMRAHQDQKWINKQNLEDRK